MIFTLNPKDPSLSATVHQYITPFSRGYLVPPIRAPQTFTFLDLLQEIRNITYDYIVLDHAHMSIITKRHSRAPDFTDSDFRIRRKSHHARMPENAFTLISLSNTCRQLCSETELLPFALLRMNCEAPSTLLKFLKRLRQSQRDAIRNLTLGVYMVRDWTDLAQICGAALPIRRICVDGRLFAPRGSVRETTLADVTEQIWFILPGLRKLKLRQYENCDMLGMRIGDEDWG